MENINHELFCVHLIENVDVIPHFHYILAQEEHIEKILKFPIDQRP